MWRNIKNDRPCFFCVPSIGLSAFFLQKTNLSLGSPLFTSAGTNAVAPGRHSTVIPFSTQARVSKNPGSDIAGVPASEIKAMVSPPLTLKSSSLLFYAHYAYDDCACASQSQSASRFTSTRVFCQNQVYFF
jgi:hypothetical protein